MKKIFDRLRRWLIKKLGGYTEQLTPIRREVAQTTDVPTEKIQVQISVERRDLCNGVDIKQFCENRLMEMLMQKIKESGFIRWESWFDISESKVNARATIVAANANSLRPIVLYWVE